MPVKCHKELIAENHLVHDQEELAWDMAKAEFRVVKEAATRKPTSDEIENLPDGLVYDLVAKVRGITRAHAAFERFTCDRTGIALDPPLTLVAYWQGLDAAELPEAGPFSDAAAIREAAAEAIGEDLANDIMRATCRMFPFMETKLEGAAIEALKIVISEGFQ